MNEEILQGLKNALERGFSIESATESFINAGYNPAEVREASDSISNKPEFTKLPTSSEPSRQESKSESPIPSTPSVSEPTTEKSPEASPKLKLILLIMLLLVVVGGAISILLFKSEILDSFSSLFG